MCQMILGRAQVRGRAIDTATRLLRSSLTRPQSRPGAIADTRHFRDWANLVFVSFSEKSFVKALYHVTMLVSL